MPIFSYLRLGTRLPGLTKMRIGECCISRVLSVGYFKVYSIYINTIYNRELRVRLQLRVSLFAHVRHLLNSAITYARDATIS